MGSSTKRLSESVLSKNWLFVSKNKSNPRLFIPIFAIVGILFLVFSQAAGLGISLEPESSNLNGCAQNISDPTASRGFAVQFGCSASLAGLDSSGKTIPSSGYTIPTTNVIYLATNGNDANAGTVASPVATMGTAVSKAVDGGTIVVRGGEYRQGDVTVGKNLSILGYPGEQAWFNGTDIVPGSIWTNNGDGRWWLSWQTPNFCSNDGQSNYYLFPYDAQNSNNSGPCTHADMYSDPNNPTAGDPQMVFINDTYVRQVPSLASVAPGSNNFYHDFANRRIYVGQDPANKTVEVTKRPQALELGAQKTFTLKGVGFRKFASNEHESVTTSGTVFIGAYKATVENVVFTRNAARGLAFSNPKNGTALKNSVFAFNGYNGLGANGGISSGTRNDFLIEGNVFNNNNTEYFGTDCTRSCGSAGAKLGNMFGFTVKNNVFENNLGEARGFWCDPGCTEGKMIENVARYNGTDGIFYEVSNNGIIASNVTYNNGYAGIRDASANTKIYNNTSVNNAVHNIWIYDDPRLGGITGGKVDGLNVGPDTVNISVANNILYGQANPTFKASNGQNLVDTYLVLFNNNSYYRPAPSTKLINWSEKFYTSLASLKTDTLRPNRANYETNGRDITDGSSPFVDLNSKNFNLKTGSPELNSGTGLPADVATLLGVPAGTVLNRGAVNWPGK